MQKVLSWVKSLNNYDTSELTLLLIILTQNIVSCTLLILIPVQNTLMHYIIILIDIYIHTLYYHFVPHNFIFFVRHKFHSNGVYQKKS